MDNYSESVGEQKEVPKCRLKVKAWPKYACFENTFPYGSREELHKILPSPIVKWSDYCQDLSDSANEVKRDFVWMKRLKEKSELIKERRRKNGEEQ